MYLAIGSYQFPVASLSFTTTSRKRRNNFGQPTYLDHSWNISGDIVGQGLTAAEIATAMLAMEAALVDGTDVIWRDGTPASPGTTLAHEILNANTIDGTHFGPLSWVLNPQGQHGSGAQFVNRRDFRFTVTATTLYTGVALVSWHESVQRIGDGGARWNMAGSINGPVQQQYTQQFTPYSVIQQGRAVGLTQWPIPATPLYPPSYEHTDKRSIVYDTPMNMGRIPTNWPVRWRMVFESATALT